MWRVRGGWRQGRPRIYARLVLARLGVFTDRIPFLLETGVRSTTVHWHDRLLFKTERGEALPLDTEFAERAVSAEIEGVPVEYGREQAHIVLFAEQGHWLVANDPIAVNIAMRPDRGRHSLLGQDLLHRMRVDLNAPQNELILQWPPGAASVLRNP